jgi:hypothetical protein
MCPVPLSFFKIMPNFGFPQIPSLFPARGSVPQGNVSKPVTTKTSTSGVMLRPSGGGHIPALRDLRDFHSGNKSPFPNFDIRKNVLANMDDVHYQGVQLDNAGYYLVPVRKNTAISIAVDALSVLEKEMEALCVEIDKGNWEEVSHLYPQKLSDGAKKRYDAKIREIAQKRNISEEQKMSWQNKKGLHEIYVKDMLLYVHAAGRISDEEHITAHGVLNKKEQFEQEIDPEYAGLSLPKGEKCKLPSRKEKTEMFSLFEENGQKFTPAGHQYLQQVLDNLQKQYEQDDFPRGRKFDRNEWERNLTRVWRENVPRNLQVFFRIENKHIAEAEAADRWWQSSVTSLQMPLAAVPKKHQTEHGRFYFSSGMEDDFFHLPSGGLNLEYLKLIDSHPVKPKPCLGSIGDRKFGKAHDMGCHLVATRDIRTLSNPLVLHEHMAGALHAYMHDFLVHPMYATAYPQERRTLCGSTFPDIVDTATEKDNEFEEKNGGKIIANLVDMAYHDAHLLEIQEFLLLAIETADELKNPPTLEDYKKCVIFVKKIMDGIKNGSTPKLPQQTLGQTYDWDMIEKFIAEKEMILQIAQEKGLSLRMALAEKLEADRVEHNG